MTVHFVIETDIAAPVEAAFTLSLDIDAHVGSMSASDERAVAGVTSGRIGLGETVTWRARHFGIWWTMTSKITEIDEPHRFVDQQVRGPFTSFHHEHRFTPTETGTRMTDTITFAAPLGVLGRFAETVALRHYLPKLIEERNAYLQRTLES